SGYVLLGATQALPMRPAVDRLVRGRGVDAVAWAGVALLAASFVLITSGARFPGWRALMPTLSAAAIMAAGPQAWLNRRVLGSRFLVGIGLISYPLYLWHWPLLSFLQVAEGGAPTTGQKAIAVAVAFALAAATY